MLEFPRLSREQALWLEKPFEETEMHEVIRGFNGDKSPGPDGFPVVFFQSCWDILESDLLAVFQYFYDKSQFEKRLNATFITLSPKNIDAVEERDFRPFSLIGGIQNHC